MDRNPGISMNIHVKDDTRFESQRVPSTDIDFVALKLGWEVGVLLFTSAQAKALAEAADDAYFTLRSIEAEKEREVRTASRINDYSDYADPADPDGVICTIENPCEGCREYNDDYEYEPF